jgi:hypothetical protein
MLSMRRGVSAEISSFLVKPYVNGNIGLAIGKKLLRQSSYGPVGCFLFNHDRCGRRGRLILASSVAFVKVMMV